MLSEHESGSTSSCGAYDRLFEVGIAHLRRYVSVHGSARPPGGATIDGFLIASWVDSRRTEYRRGRLSAERIRRIETEFPDWRWTVRSTATDRL
ncbi:UNVERIFIED_ORG: helicase associated protein [Gordonia westfalica J30]